jgi:hypothetical protein
MVHHQGLLRFLLMAAAAVVPVVRLQLRAVLVVVRPLVIQLLLQLVWRLKVSLQEPLTLTLPDIPVVVVVARALLG